MICCNPTTIYFHILNTCSINILDRHYQQGCKVIAECQTNDWLPSHKSSSTDLTFEYETSKVSVMWYMLIRCVSQICLNLSLIHLFGSGDFWTISVERMNLHNYWVGNVLHQWRQTHFDVVCCLYSTIGKRDYLNYKNSKVTYFGLRYLTTIATEWQWCVAKRCTHTNVWNSNSTRLHTHIYLFLIHTKCRE